MAYLDIKKEVVHLTGRFDLVVNLTAYASATPVGVDRYVKAAQRWLDSIATHRKEFRWERKDIAVGDVLLNIQNTRAIKEVWIVDATEKTQLEKKPLGWLREEYQKPKASLTQGDPCFYAPVVNGLSPNQQALTSSDFTTQFTYDSDDILFADVADHFTYNGVLFYPPPDQVWTMSVLGKFFEKFLSGDSDKNYWTEVYPEILVDATRMMLERSYRNREGVLDMRQQIIDSLLGLANDEYDEEVSGANQQAG